MSKAFKYKAFISYSHKDEVFSRRLHRRLEKYRIPKNIRQKNRTLKPIFRDREELAASSGLTASIQEALVASENLIVICSPNAVKSKWVNEEVLFFKKLGRESRIFTVIADGEPNVSEIGGAEKHECLPNAVRFELGQNGQLGSVKAEPLAADFRPQGDGEKFGLLKLISGLSDLGLDNLVQRDLMRARRRLTMVTVSAATIIATLGGLTWTAYQAQQKAFEAQQEADARRADAEDLVEFMLSDLRGQLETYGRLDLMESVGDKAIEYYGQFEETEFSADARGRRARTLHFIGELQDALGKTTQADTYFLKSYEMTKEAALKEPDNPDRVMEHAKSAYLRSVPLRRAGKYADEIIFLEEYARLAKRLFEIEKGSDRSNFELATAKINLGRIKYRLGDADAAQKEFNSANIFLENITSRGRDIKTYLKLAESLSWLAVSYGSSGDHAKSYDIRQKQVEILKAQYELRQNDFRLFEGLIYAELGFGNAARHVEKYTEAMEYHRSVISRADTALKIEPGREKMVRAKVAALDGLLRTSLSIENKAQYDLYRQDISSIQSQAAPASGKEHQYWESNLPTSLAKLDESYEQVFGTPFFKP